MTDNEGYLLGRVLLGALLLAVVIAGFLVLQSWAATQLANQAAQAATTPFPIGSGPVIPVTTPWTSTTLQIQPITPWWDQPSPTHAPAGSIYIGPAQP